MATRRKKINITEEMQMEAENQIKSQQKEIDYDLRDFTIDYIVQEFENGRFYIPPYQREFIWRPNNKTKFIESVILGLPIPFMFFADTDDGRLEIIDGAQRIQTLQEFHNNDLVLKNLEKLPSLNGFLFKDLPIAQQRKFENRALRVILLEDRTSLEIRHEIFSRINTAGKKATPSEIRKGAYSGPFMDFVKRCSENELFIKLCPIGKALRDRGEALEFVIRFFAYVDHYKEVKQDVSKFLDEYVKEQRSSFDQERLENEFLIMLNFVDRYFEFGFAKSKNSKSTPRVRFEALSVGIALALRENPNITAEPQEWINSDEFLENVTTHASNNQGRLAKRIEFVRDTLLRGDTYARGNN
ncbi:DUF262 domain-containing protein [Bacillus altitudinis]|uniref:GmrSD restriction endonuclease domain-containing protein n=1 Tax=Bacillus altitudinis TaxID=293387 RepID=UPI0009341CA2|nr:DUF262 domain-containing protein [Bacillus altitudinis]OJT56065.1 hypothetical protein BFP48_14305 [Bacillus altitudinis]